MKRQIFIVLLLFSSIVFSVPFLYDQGTDARDSSGIIETGNLTIQIWDSATGGNLLYEENFTNAIRNGSWVVILDNLSFMKYSGVYYKDYQINGVDLDFDGNERIPFISPIGIINSSWINSSQIQLRVTGTCSNNQAIRVINEDGSVVCVDINSTSVTSGFNETNPPYLYDNGTTIFFNETKLNETIDARDNDSHAEGQQPWLYNDSTYMYFNETKLNETIDIRSNYTNGTGINITNKEISIMGCGTGNHLLQWNGSSWQCVNASVHSLYDTDWDTGIDAEKNPDEDYLRFTTNGTERMRIDNLGHVKIGAVTTGDSPTDPLFAVGEGAYENTVFSVTGSPSYSYIANFRDEDGENIFKLAGKMSSNDMLIQFGDYDDSYSAPSFSLSQADSNIKFSSGSHNWAIFKDSSIRFNILNNMRMLMNNSGTYLNVSAITSTTHILSYNNATGQINYIDVSNIGQSPWTNNSQYTYVKSAYPKQLYSQGYLNLSQWGVAIGNGAVATGYNAVGIGVSASATGSRATAVGYSSQASAYASVAYGWYSIASGQSAIAIGYGAEANATKGYALGYFSKAHADSSLAIGDTAIAESEGSVALGRNSEANRTYQIAMRGNEVYLYPYNTTGVNLSVVGMRSEDSGYVVNYNPTSGEFTYTTASTGLSDTSPPYLYDNGTTVFFNETKLNETINESKLWKREGNNLMPRNESITKIVINNSYNGYTQVKLINTNDSGNVAGAVLELKGSGAEYTNNVYFGKYGNSFWIPLFAGNGVLMTDKNLVVGSVGTGAYGNLYFLSGDSYTNPNTVAMLNKSGFGIYTNLSALDTRIHDLVSNGSVYLINLNELNNTNFVIAYNSSDGQLHYINSSDIGKLNSINCGSGELIQWNGSEWICTNVTVSPAGNNGEIQFNDNGNFGADSNLYWDNTNKRLGVGTNSPSYTLDVNGDTRTTQNVYIGNRLGIGTTSPSSYITIYDSFVNTIDINHTGDRAFITSSISAYSIADIDSYGNPQGLIIDSKGGDLVLRFGTNGALIKPSEGASTHGLLMLSGLNDTPSPTYGKLVLVYGEVKRMEEGTYPDRFSLYQNGTHSVLYSNNSPIAFITNGDRNDYLYIQTSSNTVQLKTFAGDGEGHLVLMPVGDVGIGTTSPEQKLDVEGAIEIGNTTNGTNGTIRYTGSDFEGYVSGTWKSFTNDTDTLSSLGCSASEVAMYNGSEWVCANMTAESPWTNNSQYTYVKSSYPKQLYSEGYMNVSDNGVIIGRNSSLSGSSSVAIGGDSVAGSSALAVGYNSNASGYYSSSFGFESLASGSSSVAVGYHSSATAYQSIAFGANSYVSSASAIALGSRTNASGTYAIALGYNSASSGIASMALGYLAQSTEDYLLAARFDKVYFYPYNATGVNFSVVNLSNISTGYVVAYNPSSGQFTYTSYDDSNYVKKNETSKINGSLIVDNITVGDPWTFYTNGSDLRFYNGTNDTFAVTQEGRVGIGTVSPEDKLEIQSETPFTHVFSIRSAGTPNDYLLRVYDANRRATLELYEYNSARVKLDSSADSFIDGGNLGVGTTSPQERLHVVSNETALRIDSFSYSPSATIENASILSTGGPGVSELSLNSEGARPDIKFLENSNTRAQIRYDITLNGLVFVADDNISGSGPVGGDPSMTISGVNHYVGVGTYSPETLLHVAGTGGTARLLVEDSAFGGEFIRLSAGAGAGGLGVSDTASYMAFVTIPRASPEGAANKFLMTISTNGTVAIGNSYYGYNTNASDLLVEGKVGVGTTSPEQKLDVEGAIEIGNTTNGTNGTIRYTGSDFEGYVSGTWKSFTNDTDTLSSLSCGSNEVAKYNGSEWVCSNATFAPAGSNGQVQFNDNGEFGADSTFSWNNATKILTINSGSNYDTRYRLVAGTKTGDLYLTQAGAFNLANTGGTIGLYSGGYTTMVLLNRNVGIGTTSPQERLSIIGGNISINTGTTDGEAYTKYIDDGSESSRVGFTQDIGGSGISGYEIETLGNGFGVSKNNNPLIFIGDTSDYVGIGTNSPIALLHIDTKGATNDGLFLSGDDINFAMGSSGTNWTSWDYFRVSGEDSELRSKLQTNIFDGKVAINTTNATHALTVNGDENITDNHSLYIGGGRMYWNGTDVVIEG